MERDREGEREREGERARQGGRNWRRQRQSVGRARDEGWEGGGKEAGFAGKGLSKGEARLTAYAATGTIPQSK